MEETQSKPSSSLAVRLLKLPLQGLWFLVKHPIVAIIVVILIAFSSFSFLAHFNQAIADRLNSAVGYFGSSILVSEASAIIKRKNAALRKSSQALKHSSRVLKASATKIEKQAVAITSKNKALLKSVKALEGSSRALKNGSAEIKLKTNLLKDHEMRLVKFRARGDLLKERTKKRSAKVAFLNTTGEIIGFIPIVGDVASLGLTAGGIYEMCQMFKEIERATEDLGVRYNVYTGTFCEKPAQKTVKVVSSALDDTGDYLSDRVFSTQQYWSNRFSEWF